MDRLNIQIFIKDTQNKLIYKVDRYRVESNYIHYSADLVAGWDYVNPDRCNEQGWCKPDRFVADVQSIDLIQYFVNESLTECIESNGYEICQEPKVK